LDGLALGRDIKDDVFVYMGKQPVWVAVPGFLGQKCHRCAALFEQDTNAESSQNVSISGTHGLICKEDTHGQ